MTNKILTPEAWEDLSHELLALSDRWYASLPDVKPVPPVEPPVVVPPKTGWSVGVWAQHDATLAAKWFDWIGRGPGRTRSHVTMFVTHKAGISEMTNGWWMERVPTGRGLSLRVPLVPAGAPNLKADLTDTWKIIARQAASIDPNALVCPGWEMNLPGWAHKVTSANADQWRDAWARCYDTMKAEAPGLIIGFNPNGGDLGQTGIDIRRVMDTIEYDAAGPDQYDCWPGMTGTANTATMFSRPGGLQWWADVTQQMKVPLIVPEWGVSSGDQWKGHTGGDNDRYIGEMFAFFHRTPHLSHESYFNEPDWYIKSDLFLGGKATSNPKAAAAYQGNWKTLP